MLNVSYLQFLGYFYGLVTSKPTPYLAFSRGGGVIG